MQELAHFVGHDHGWGDRTRKIVGSFLLSVVLNRTFIIDMTWPCSITHILTSNFIQWNNRILLNKNYSSINITTLTSQDYDKLMAYDKLYDVLYIQTSNIAYFNLIIQQSHLYSSLKTRFNLKHKHIHIQTLYQLLYDLLIQLKPNIKIKLNQLLKQIKPNTTLLCGQLRIGRNPTNPKDVVFPKREKMNVTVMDFLVKQSKITQSKVFITTDSNDVQYLARQTFKRSLLEINGTIAHIDRDWNYLGCASLEKTIVEFHMLSYCHTAVISKSSFGYLAVMRRSQPYKQLYLYCDGIKKINNATDYDKFVYSTC
ncbi:unnamed protein product [Didymodactylos carnosus]|uniref:Uncharacterized protein n=1 Tax=Didymodactylos carnosus TaxID=1234261 RepID=A0A813TX15_9BILA|nr:unnamed protein product [Didymodactylos carnosus]CAF3604894.1 unnamed protein product [Didymodactylos carnosus]